MFETILTSVLSILPPILLLVYVYRKDRINKEPVKLLLLLFVLGCLSSIPVYFIETYLELVLYGSIYNYTLYNLLDAFICAAFVEELTKFLITKTVIWNHEAFDSTFDGMVYCAFVSMGFATVENVLYAIRYGMSAVLSRAISSIPGHFSFAIVMGIFMSRSKFSYRKQETEKIQYLDSRNSLIYALLVPILYHGLYDFCLMQGSTVLLLIFNGIVLSLYYVILKVVNKESKKDQLF
ncbi:MAG: PrsW family intramembrane metalloprotease [Erysipelotrichaceae bacterium]|nr:PrsW family intramembrane metalloprotease [Erysipelotrichaceae bacterium]